MKLYSLRGALLASTFIAGSLASPALAQSTDESASEDAIVVTGSRLKQSNLVAISPVTQLDAGEIDARGTTRIEDLINILPQAFAGQTSQVSNGATGTSNVNLRGLGAVRTLVLIDGKRLPFGSPESSAANLDLIPAQLVERVDVLTGGASAVYGSDAMAGVVNFILKRDFEGVEFDGQIGYYQDSNSNDFAQSVAKAAKQPAQGGSVFDGRNINLSATFGANTADGRGNVTVNLSYSNQNAVEQRKRDISACAFGLDNGPQSFGGVACIGSSTSATGRFFAITPNGINDVFLQPDGQIVPFVGGPAQTFNFNPFNFMQRPSEKFNFTTMAHYEIKPNLEAYLDLSLTDNQTNAQIAPSGTFAAHNPSIPCSNPFFGSGPGSFFDAFGCTGPNDNATVFILRRDVEGGPRNSDLNLTTFRMVGGFRGTLKDNIDWDTFGQFSRTRYSTISRNDISIANLDDAFNVVLDANGNPVCASGNAGCVPYNIFQIGGVTQAAVDYITEDAFVNGFVEQKIIGGNAQTDLGVYGVKSPMASSGVQLSTGYEYRVDQLELTPDALSATPGGGLTGVGGATLPVAGKTRVFELFAETQIPLVEGAAFAEELTLNGAYRYSDYTVKGNGVDNGFTTDTYSAGLTWVPVHDVRLRGQYQRAVRAPNIIELFSAQNTGLFDLQQNPDGSFDDCAGPTPFRSLTECARTGVTAAQYGNIPDNAAGQFNIVTGGNPNLKPEVSDTYTIGTVIQPSMIPGLSVSVDYFDIKVKQAISTIPPVQTFERCLDTGDAAFCSLITRDTAGSLFLDNTSGGILATAVNIATLKTSGFDIAAGYQYDLGKAGSLNFSYVGTILDALKTTSFPGSPAKECKGLVSGECGTPNPEYRHRMMGTWSSPFDVDMSLTWRYFGSVNRDGGPQGTINDHFSAKNYFDLSGQYYASERVTFRGGINNLLDVDPPLSTETGAGFGNGNTYPGVYDSLGRYLFFGINVKM
ncbi:MAG: TonB-dependent receptor [Robiginitomaculum sp.]|nr:TonB-dependent receptor [Robiginitomaculum sp.]MDQ7076914.1 TonB-dependent receptor [Robiginitomaculum sp.]